jgi:hypothetical protein
MSSYKDTAIAAGAVAVYMLDDLNDSVGGSNATWTTAGKFVAESPTRGLAAEFVSASAQYATTPVNANMPSTQPLCIACWVKPITAARMTPFRHGSSNGWGPGMSASRQAQFTAFGTFDYIFSTAPLLTLAKWTLMTVNYNSDFSADYYVNGVFSQKVTNASGASVPPSKVSYIGASDTLTDRWNGQVWGVAVFNNVLTATQIQQLYDSAPKMTLPKTLRPAIYKPGIAR